MTREFLGLRTQNFRVLFPYEHEYKGRFSNLH